MYNFRFETYHVYGMLRLVVKTVIVRLENCGNENGNDRCYKKLSIPILLRSQGQPCTVWVLEKKIICLLQRKQMSAKPSSQYMCRSLSFPLLLMITGVKRYNMRTRKLLIFVVCDIDGENTQLKHTKEKQKYVYKIRATRLTSRYMKLKNCLRYEFIHGGDIIEYSGLEILRMSKNSYSS